MDRQAQLPRIDGAEPYRVKPAFQVHLPPPLGTLAGPWASRGLTGSAEKVQPPETEPAAAGRVGALERLTVKITFG